MLVCNICLYINNYNNNNNNNNNDNNYNYNYNTGHRESTYFINLNMRRIPLPTIAWDVNMKIFCVNYDHEVLYYPHLFKLAKIVQLAVMAWNNKNLTVTTKQRNIIRRESAKKDKRFGQDLVDQYQQRTTKSIGGKGGRRSVGGNAKRKSSSVDTPGILYYY